MIYIKNYVNLMIFK